MWLTKGKKKKKLCCGSQKSKQVRGELFWSYDKTAIDGVLGWLCEPAVWAVTTHHKEEEKTYTHRISLPQSLYSLSLPRRFHDGPYSFMFLLLLDFYEQTLKTTSL